jgi:hypothetical protein
MSDLGDALERSRQMIKDALTDARNELAEVQRRQTELEQQIAEAEAALGHPSGQSVLTLHEALAQVLRENLNQPMTAAALTDIVNGRGLYRRRDGKPVQANQVHARTKNYKDVFEKGAEGIRLREEHTWLLVSPPQGVSIFQDFDQGFFDWLEEHPEGYFINADRNPRKDYLVLHRPGCPHFKGSPDLNWTKSYIKVCSEDRGNLDDWAEATTGGEVTLCSSCFEQTPSS